MALSENPKTMPLMANDGDIEMGVPKAKIVPKKSTMERSVTISTQAQRPPNLCVKIYRKMCPCLAKNSKYSRTPIWALFSLIYGATHVYIPDYYTTQKMIQFIIFAVVYLIISAACVYPCIESIGHKFFVWTRVPLWAKQHDHLALVSAALIESPLFKFDLNALLSKLRLIIVAFTVNWLLLINFAAVVSHDIVHKNESLVRTNDEIWTWQRLLLAISLAMASFAVMGYLKLFRFIDNHVLRMNLERVTKGVLNLKLMLTHLRQILSYFRALSLIAYIPAVIGCFVCTEWTIYSVLIALLAYAWFGLAFWIPIVRCVNSIDVWVHNRMLRERDRIFSDAENIQLFQGSAPIEDSAQIDEKTSEDVTMAVGGGAPVGKIRGSAFVDMDALSANNANDNLAHNQPQINGRSNRNPPQLGNELRAPGANPPPPPRKKKGNTDNSSGGGGLPKLSDDSFWNVGGDNNADNNKSKAAKYVKNLVRFSMMDDEDSYFANGKDDTSNAQKSKYKPPSIPGSKQALPATKAQDNKLPDTFDYTVSYETMDLGIEFGSNPDGQNCSVKKCVSDRSKKYVEPFSQLVSINGEWVIDWKFEYIEAALKQASLPLQLTFRTHPTSHLFDKLDSGPAIYLKVKVVRAVHLKSLGNYATVTVGPAVLSTHKVPNREHPEWQEMLIYKNHNMQQYSRGKVAVWAQRKLLKDKCLGEAVLDLPIEFDTLKGDVLELIDAEGNVSGLLVLYSTIVRRSRSVVLGHSDNQQRYAKPHHRNISSNLNN